MVARARKTGDDTMNLACYTLRKANLQRVSSFGHGGLEAWTPGQWAVAMCGEVGELCNAAKKLWRGDGDPEKLGSEIADVVIYADLLAARLNISPEFWAPSAMIVDVGQMPIERTVEVELVAIREVWSGAASVMYSAACMPANCSEHLRAMMRSLMVLARWHARPLASDIVRTFNAKSDQIGSPVKLPTGNEPVPRSRDSVAGID